MAGSGRRNADDAFLLALASGKTIKDAAQECGISERTAFRRVAEPNFRRRLNQLRADMVARAVGRLADSMTEAADKLRGLLGARSETVQLGAARSLLELGVRLKESVELEERLAAVEEQLERASKVTAEKTK